MTEEQRRQVAAQRCADMANEASHHDYVPTDFTEASGANKAFLNAVLQLDELARKVDGLWTRLPQSLVDAAKPHILPEPKMSPVERLAQRTWLEANSLAKQLENLGLELREKKP